MKVRSHVVGIGGAFAMIASAAPGMPVLGASATVVTSSPPAFAMSGLPALTRGASDRPAFEAASVAAATRSAGKRGPSVGPNVNVIGGQDVVQQATINGVAVNTHTLWTDVRVEPSTTTDPGGTNQDPFTATLSS